MTPEAKEALRKTIRGLRERLLAELQEEAERVYRLGVPLEKAKLPEERAKRRARLEAWAEEQTRSDWPKDKKGEPKKPNEKALKELRERYLRQAVKEAAHTLINRLVLLRLLEEGELSKPKVLTDGWKSKGYVEFKSYADALCTDVEDDTKGYAALLQLVFDELSQELPGVFGKVGLTSLFPIPAATLREVVEALNEPALASVWSDDTTLGWVYQFWNDPERESLDEKINGGGKIEPHEIASKTQMFTERYMVEWLLQNSLGQTWLAMCAKNGWTPDFESVRVPLDERRAEWRKKREAGEVAPDALMPIRAAGPDGDLEEHWKYWVPQPMPEDAPASAPARLAELRLLDPACGSGHFLVIAFDLLAALYREEARHRGEELGDEAIARSILEKNLHGVDIDPRAIQIAAAALWLKAKLFAPKAKLERLNLVAPTFRLAGLAAEDAALAELKKRLKVEVGIPESLTAGLVSALDGVDHLGTLLRVDKKVRETLYLYEKENFGISAPKAQITMFGEEPKEKIQLTLDEAEASVTKQLAKFLDAHEGEGDLGLRLEGEQLAAGLRFLEIVREGTFDVVVGNPPYQGTAKMAEAEWFKKNYPRSKADLYACFLERGLELAKAGGVSALLTMRGWMFLSSYQDLREGLLKENELTLLGDIDRGGFEDIPDEVVAASMSLFSKRRPSSHAAVAVQPTPLEDKSRDGGRTSRKKAALLAQVGRFEFDVAKLAGIEGTPLVYWWSEEFLDEYVKAPKLGEVSPGRQGMASADNPRFVRRVWEIKLSDTFLEKVEAANVVTSPGSRWVPYIKGGEGRIWHEPVREMLRWWPHMLQVRNHPRSYPKNERFFFGSGIAFAPIGATFAARAHRFKSAFDVMGQSVFSDDVSGVLCSMNSRIGRLILEALNPSVHFQVGDVNRLPSTPPSGSREIVRATGVAFSHYESHREPSVEFKRPGPSPWRYAQDWAQRAVDRPKGEPLPVYEEELDPPEPASFVSFAIGVALGRFGENGEGILDLSLPPGAKNKTSSVPSSPSNDSDSSLEIPNIEPSPLPEGQSILPHGILFLSAAPNVPDSSADPAFARIEAAWSEHGAAITSGKATLLGDWLRADFFAYHKSLYENRPIYFPLSSEKKSFVAWISIHRWADNTLQALLASYLYPAREKLQGEIHDLNQARASSDKKIQAAAEKQYSKTQKLFEELEKFLADVTQLAEKGAPPVDNKCPPREVDATFRMDLDDGVMINSAALWPLLEPQWKDPKKWWKELATAEGRKDYDWAHLAARYFPKRVDEKCKNDPSLAVAHGCFWRYHPAKAYAWELRLKDEIGPEFTIDEDAKWDDFNWDDGTKLDGPCGASDKHREAFLRDHPTEAAEIRAKEEQRRERKRNKAERAESDSPEDEDLADFQLEAE